MSICRAHCVENLNALTLPISGKQVRLQVPPKLYRVHSWIAQIIRQWVTNCWSYPIRSPLWFAAGHIQSSILLGWPHYTVRCCTYTTTRAGLRSAELKTVPVYAELKQDWVIVCSRLQLLVRGITCCLTLVFPFLSTVLEANWKRSSSVLHLSHSTHFARFL